MSIPTCLAIASAVFLLSPVTIATFIPKLCKSSTALLLLSFTTSLTAIIPASSFSIDINIGVLPCLDNSSYLFSTISKDIFKSSIIFTLPRFIFLLSIIAFIPFPVTELNFSTLIKFIFFSSAYLTIASPSGCSDPFSADAANFNR